MVILNFFVIVLQQGEPTVDILSAVVPFIFAVLIFGLPTYFIAKAKGRKSYWYLMSGIIPALSIIIMIVLWILPKKEKDRIEVGRRLY